MNGQDDRSGGTDSGPDLASAAPPTQSEGEGRPTPATRPPTMSVFLLVVLTVITLGIFAGVWFLTRRQWINTLESPVQLGTQAPVLLLACGGVSALLSMAPPEVLQDIGGAGSASAGETVTSVLDLLFGVIVLVQSFKVRTIFHDHWDRTTTDTTGRLTRQSRTRLSGGLTFFFTIFYLQYKINTLWPRPDHPW